MKIIAIFFILIVITGCSSEKLVYWCGDHQCINKKERKAYFEKTMIVEVKTSKKKYYKKTSYIEELQKEAKSEVNIKQKDEKKNIDREKKRLSKQMKLEEKKRIKEEKKIAKQMKLEEKRRIKMEKELNKQTKLNKKKLIKKKSIKDSNKNTEIGLIGFNDLVENILKKNAFKSYPDINSLPN